MNIYCGKLLSFEDYEIYLQMALALSQRSVAKRLQVGCIITDNTGLIIGSGFNHMPHNMTETCEIEDGKVSHPLVVHAEKDAIRNCTARNMLLGSIAFVTDVPCLACAEELLSAGVHKVVYSRDYRLTEGLELLLGHHVHVYRVGKFGEVDKVLGVDGDGVTVINCHEPETVEYLKHLMNGVTAKTHGLSDISLTNIAQDDTGYYRQIENEYDDWLKLSIEHPDRMVLRDSQDNIIQSGSLTSMKAVILDLVKTHLQVTI